VYNYTKLLIEHEMSCSISAELFIKKKREIIITASTNILC